ncbi:MAG: ATP-grasp domain-containing protein [Beijerinckiaceae bacterium]|nr:ATP-grasp domain-containing protein [Beijerinckiaceae bacterium]MCI0735186.1 ATP-grasp domain-containing protein [Beijerinckiaceae bacterium]
MPERGAAILIAAASGRALAQAAQRAGYRPLVADFFDDADTRELCAANCLVEAGLETGFSVENLIPALDTLTGHEAPCGLVYGAGFEDRPELLAALTARWKLLGNPPEVVRHVKDPKRLAGLCALLRIPHPKVSMRLPASHRHWLAKRAGGSGGTHVAPAAAFRAEAENIYFQRLTAGEPISIQFLADGNRTQVIGVCRQWVAPAPGEPYRFGGILRPANLPPGMEDRLRQAADAVTAACRLRGLNSIDFLVEESAYTLIEINPRPGAALDIFENEKGSLFQAHLNACAGRLPGSPVEFSGAAAAAIAYTRRPIASMPNLDWPEWTADRQRTKSQLHENEPLCTVKARAAAPMRARALADARTNLILDKLAHSQNNNASMGRKPRLEHERTEYQHFDRASGGSPDRERRQITRERHQGSGWRDDH